MLHSIAGLNVEQVGLVVHALSQAGSKDLACIFITSLALIDSTLVMVLKEMFSTRRHILYWNQLAKSARWELVFYLINSKLFKLVFARKERDYLILDESELMLRHAEMLRCDLDDLSIFLDKISAAGAELKAVYLQLASMGGTLSDARRRSPSNFASADNKSELELADLSDGNAAAEIGVQLGMSMSSLGDISEALAENTHALGLSIPSEDEELVVREGGADVLEQHQQYRFQGREEEREDELRMIRELTRRRLEACLLGLAECFAEYLPHLVQGAGPHGAAASSALPSASAGGVVGNTAQQLNGGSLLVPEPAAAPYAVLNSTGRRSDLAVPELEEVFCNLETFVDHLRATRGAKEFPLKFTQVRVHKPSDRERFWFRRILFGVLGAFSVKVAVDLWRDGSIASAYAFALSKLRDHIIEPMEKLASELFDTIRKRDYVVTREECDESRESLHRMLHEFSQTSKGSTLISDMKARVQETLREQQEAASAMASKISQRATGGGSGSGSGGAVDLKPADVVPKVPQAGWVAAEVSPEQAMAALMSAYERELQAPIQGVVFGNLMTAILIQMQKLKVHTEAAMLTMDQILASNELTIAATAAMPAFGFLGMSVFYLRKWLQPRATAPGLATMHLRLIMCDVERSLLEVQELGGRADGPHHGRSAHLPRLGAVKGSVGSGDIRSSPSKRTMSTSTLLGASSPIPEKGIAATPSLARGRSQSISSVEEKDGRVLEAKLARYQQNVLARRLLIAQGRMRFNLVRLRSEFQNLFGTDRSVSTVGGNGKSRALAMTRGASARGGALGLGRLNLSGAFLSPHGPDAAIASTVRKWRLHRSSSATAGLALSDGGAQASSNAPASGAAEQDDTDAGRAELILQMLTIMQRDERIDFRGHGYTGIASWFATAAELLRSVASMFFSAGEELTSTTQYSSLSRDIAILEAPEFEASLDQKLRTAARMRAAYTCLMPLK